ncbi:hypothetical protein BJ508DRAFT_412378 [Ascobolus immersus RN42]|uniref:Uncharacterized protein n=1 Tax=Ascobolus immersus RN42 TaxID=1160509 RepID=A0A3N4IJU0_ASCIM|nr:hypothetical protein BJ508DRAFT_412378 [Ascobolus immersus RN42]
MGFYDQIQAARTVNRAMQRYSAFELLPLEILTQIFRELDEFHFTDHFEYPYKRNSTRWYSANASLVSWRVRHAVIPSLFANLRFSLAAENGVDRPTYPPLFSELSRRFAKRVYFCTEVAKGHTLLQSDFLDYAMAEFIDMMPNLRSLRISTKIRPGPNLCIAMGQIGFQRKGTVTLDHTYSHKPTTVEVFERPPGRAHKFSLSSMLSLPHFATLTTPNLLAIENIFALNFTEKYEQDGSLHALRTPAFFDNRLPKPATEIPTPVGPTYSLRLKINSLRLADPDKYSNLSDYKHSREFDTALTGFYLSPLLLRNLQSLINFSNLCTLEISTLSEYYLFDTAYDTSTDGRQPFFTNPEIFPNLRRLTYEGALWEFLELLCDDVHHAVVPRGSQFLSELCYREGVGLRETDVESNLDTMVRYYASDFGAAPHSPQFLSIRAAAACQSYPECSYRPNYDDEEHEYLHNLGCFKRLKRLEIGICLCTPVIEVCLNRLLLNPTVSHC